jgi:hypothetical protein
MKQIISIEEDGRKLAISKGLVNGKPSLVARYEDKAFGDKIIKVREC